MIEKERLEELIEQGATIYINKYRYIGQCLLNNMMSCDNSILCIDDKDDGEVEFLINLFETEEDAEWHREFGCIERTERLELPTWEEFDKKGYIEFVGKEATKLILEKTLTIDFDREPISYYVLEIHIDDYNHTSLFEAEYVKENYTLACRRSKELFLGEKK